VGKIRDAVNSELQGTPETAITILLALVIVVYAYILIRGDASLKTAALLYATVP
jgi:hypothetical protein